MRLLGCSVLFVLYLSSFASADLKITTRTTVMGHSTESTVYIKGSRERTEMSFGGHAGSVSILQCDQKRMVTVAGGRCTVMPFGGNESSCPAMPDMSGMGHEPSEDEGSGGHKGGVVTITRTSTDTGERQEMFGYKARHMKSTMMMESTPDACNQSHMKMETDGWYADLANFSCGDESYRAMACGAGARRGCMDRIVMKGNGSALGYPLKQTMTMTTPQGTFTTTTEVTAIEKTTLDAPLFDAPPNCNVANPADTAPIAPAASEPASEKPPASPTTQPAAAPVPSAPPKAPGTIRVGLIAIKDATGQSLPLDSLQLELVSEFGRHQIDVVPLTASAPLQDVESEARLKQCDYFVFTTPTLLKDPGTGGLPSSSVPKGVTLDGTKFQALTLITMYKVGKPAPELKDVPLVAQGSRFAVDAVTATFAEESDRVAQQITDDAHPKTAPKTTKAPAHHPTGKSQ